MATTATARGADLAPANTDTRTEPRLMDGTELLDQLAQAMRLRSGLDLPHAYFVQQVKLQLSGSPAFDQSLANPDEQGGRAMPAYESAACFQAWAMRD